MVSRYAPVLRFLLLGILPLAAGHARAGVQVPTRVVFDGARQETTLTLSNPGAQPSLVQAWLDVGDPDADPATIQVPFLIAPSLVRVDPQGSHALRILGLADSRLLPQDRESRYFLNLLDVPPKADADTPEEQSRLSLAVHYRMPLLYRPAALQAETAAHPAVEAASQVHWSLRQEGSGWVLQAYNPGPYYLSFRSIRMGPSGQEHSVTGGELPPMSRSSFPLQTIAIAPPSAGTWLLHYTVADDAGYSIDGQAVVRW